MPFILLWALTIAPRFAAAVNLSENCQDGVTRPEISYLRVLGQAIDDRRLTDLELSKFAAGQLFDPFAHRTLRAPLIPLQNAMAQAFRLLRPTPELSRKVRGMAQAALTARVGTLSAEHDTRFVLAPHEMQRVTTKRYVGPMKFFWYRDQANRAFVALRQDMGSVLRVMEVQPGGGVSTVREPVPTVNIQAIRKSNYFLIGGKLKIVYYTEKRKELVLYDVSEGTGQPFAAEGAPQSLEIVQIENKTYLVSFTGQGFQVYSVTDRLLFVREINQKLDGRELLTGPRGDLRVSGRDGKTAYVFDPLRPNAFREWTFRHPVREFKCALDADGKILAAASVEGEDLQIMSEDGRPRAVPDLNQTSNLSWHRSVRDESLLSLSHRGHVLVVRPENQDALLADYPGNLNAKGRWLPSYRNQDYLAIDNPIDGEHRQISVHTLESQGLSAELAKGVAFNDDAEFLFLPQGERWLVSLIHDKRFHLINLQEADIGFSDALVSEDQSEPFEITPGHWVAAVSGQDGVRILSLTTEATH